MLLFDKASEILDFAKNENIKNPNFSFSDQKLVINPIPFNFNLNTDYVLVIVCIYLTIATNFEDKSDFVLLVMACWIGTIVCLWQDFQYMNRVTIDFNEHSIAVLPKNIAKKIFTRSVVFNFKDVDHFYHDSFSSLKRCTRYIVRMKLKNEDCVCVIDFSEEKHADAITASLNSIIKRKKEA